MKVYDVVIKLIGPIHPVGETNTDDERFENLKEMTGLVDKLLTDIDTVAYLNRGRGEYSMQRAGRFASDFYDLIGIKK